MSRFKMNQKWIIGLIISILLVVMTMPAFAEESVKVGLITPLSGFVSTYGQSVFNGVELGINDINEAGGINGRKIELIYYDDQGDATESANAARRLIDRDNVNVIIGPVISSAVLAVAPIAERNQVPLLTPTGTNDAITAQGDYIFRAAYKDSQQGEAMATFARETLNLETAAILFDVASDYSSGLADAFRDTFEELGGQIVARESYTTGDTDFSAQLTSISIRNADGLFLPDYYSTVGPIIMQARQMGIDIPLLGVDGWDSPQLTQLAGGLEEGSYIVNHYSPLDEREATQNFVAKYKEVYGEDPDALAALAYDAVLILEAALKQADSLDPAEIKDALGNAQDIEAPTAKINMDPEGTPIKPIIILQNQDGVWEIVDRVIP